MQLALRPLRAFASPTGSESDRDDAMTPSPAETAESTRFSAPPEDSPLLSWGKRLKESIRLPLPH